MSETQDKPAESATPTVELSVWSGLDLAEFHDVLPILNDAEANPAGAAMLTVARFFCDRLLVRARQRHADGLRLELDRAGVERWVCAHPGTVLQLVLIQCGKAIDRERRKPGNPRGWITAPQAGPAKAKGPA